MRTLGTAWLTLIALPRLNSVGSGSARVAAQSLGSLFSYDSGPVWSDTSGAIDAIGAGDGPWGWWTLANNSGAIGSGTSGAVDAVGAGDRMSRLGYREGQDG
jgi:hypothetical protein